MSQASQYDSVSALLEPPSVRNAQPKGAGVPGVEVCSALTHRQNFSWTFLGNLVSTACRWGILVALAKLGNPEMVGGYALALGVCTPIFTLCNINLRSVQAVDTDNEFDFVSYISLRVMTVLLALVIVAGFAFLSRLSGEVTLLIALVGLVKSLESFSDVFHGLFQRVERMDYSSKSLALSGVLSVFAIVAVLYCTQSLPIALLGLAVSWLMVLAFFDIPYGFSVVTSELGGLSQQFRTKAKFIGSVYMQVGSPATFRLALVALPLGIGTFLCALNINIPRYLIVMYNGERELGYFSALASSAIAIDLFVRALGTSAMPTLAKAIRAGDSNRFLRYITRTCLAALLFGLVAVCIASFWGKQILTIVFQDDYANYSRLFVALTVVGAISSIATTLSLATTAAHLFRQQIFVYGLSTVFIFGACMLLVPSYGLWGASAALAVAAVLRIGLYCLLLRYIVKRSTSCPLSV